MPRPRRLSSSTSLTRTLSRLSSSSPTTAVRNEHTRIYTCLIAGALLLLASVTFLQVHLASAPQGSNLTSPDNGNSELQTSWWLTDRSVDGGEVEIVSDDEETDAFKIEKWNQTLQRKAATVGEEDFETGEELEEEEEEELEHESHKKDKLAEDMELGNEEIKGVEIGDIPINASESLVLSDDIPVQDKADNGQLVQQGEKLAKTKRKVMKNRKEVIKMDSKLLDGVIDMVERQQKRQFETGGNQESGEDGERKARQGTLEQEMEKKQGLFFLDHAFGIRKKSLKIMELLGPPQQTPGGTMNLGAVKKGLDFEKHEAARVATKVSSQQLRGFKEFVETWKEQFNSDDETLDEKVQQQLEDVLEIEDALLLNEDGAVSKPLPRLPIKKVARHGRKGGSAYDPINPVNIPMLQDPDTTPDTWMTNSDKAMLKAFQVHGYVQSAPLPPKLLLRGMNVDSVIHKQNEQEIHRMLHKDAGTTENVGGFEGGAVGMRKEQTELSTELPRDREEHENLALHQQEYQPIHDIATISNGLQLGTQNKDFVQRDDFTGLHPSLPFSVFLDTFLYQDSCSIRVFMAWTTPLWSFTVCHQRTLESLLHFHPNACVVVFSETMECDFFNSFVQEGFKVAVVQPDLQELLANTPTDVFTTIWVRWRQIPLFHLHYTELLRLVALYKYGGVYMDMDMIVLKPLDSLRNTMGSEILASGEIRLNGAIMAFNKSSPFLRQCLEEFTATYDDTLLDWNGAELVTRVANSSIGKGVKRWMEDADVLQIQHPFAFFPIPSSSIFRYFTAPTDKQQQDEEKELLGRIIDEAFTTHFWNRLTASVVPEKGSIIETILNRHCLHCTEIL